FVGTAEEVGEVRDKMVVLQKELGQTASETLPKLCSKIERKQALKQLRSIIEASDAVMVARGDLGIEMPESEVILLQKHIISESLKAMRPVIVATQMMQSMVMNPRPTRAEVSDVSNAVIDHTDAVMLSEESANGKYPVETIATMREIIEKTEESPYNDLYQALDLNTSTEYAVMMRSVYELSQSFKAKAILVLSMSGFTARLLSHFRPDATIYVATNQVATWKELSLVWGVQPYFFQNDQNLDSMIERLIGRLKDEKKLQADDQVTVFYGRTPESDSMRLVGMRTIR
ncbi:MAG: pyruvate kinase, partial [Candidatus Moraniibacteriota bacterium]